LTFDKLVAEMYVGDTFLEAQDQIEDRVIKEYKIDEHLYISDIDGFMPEGNAYIRGRM
jgi:hypothetical protein